MEVIADGKHGLAGRRGRHVDGLKALVEVEGVGDSGKCGGIAADEAGELTVSLIAGAGDVVDVVAGIDGGEHASGGIGRVGDGGPAGVMNGFD